MRVGSPSVLLVLLLVVGCGEKSEKVVTVTGTVTRKGRPVPNLMVNFVPQTGKNAYPSYGKTDDAGRYSLTYFDGKPGATVGTHKVWVKIPPVPPEGNDDKKPVRAKTAPEVLEIVAKYGKLEDTPLTFEVKDTQVTDIQLD